MYHASKLIPMNIPNAPFNRLQASSSGAFKVHRGNLDPQGRLNHINFNVILKMGFPQLRVITIKHKKL
jgi:hypothetical protein